MKAALCPVAILLFASLLLPARAQVPNTNDEALVECPEIRQPEPLTPYGFAFLRARKL